MKKYPCPSCGAEIPFRTSVASHGICPYCRTMVVRDDDALRKTGEMAQLPDDMSPFQLGTEGTFNGVRFGIVGRIRQNWEDGSWNEWFIVSDDAKRGWLAEAQGFYAPCFEVENLSEQTLQAIAKMQEWAGGNVAGGDWAKSPAGQRIKIENATYKIVDIKNAECVAAEGELPFSSPQGRKSVSIDCVAGDGKFASIDLADGRARVFTGAYVDWTSLNCRYYRSFEGWKP